MSLPPPIFILASPRSFTSLVCAMLGQHPELYGVPELNLFVAETMEQLLQRFKGVLQFQLHGLLRTVAQLYAGEQTMLSIEMARRWNLNRLDRSTGEVYAELCQKVTPLRIVDKSPAYPINPEALERIKNTFPDACYLHLIRHPKTQGESVMKIAGGMMAKAVDSFDYSTQPPTLDPQYAWYKTQSNILEFLSKVPSSQQRRFRGEDVLGNPRLHLEQISKWLGISWNESILEAMLRPQDSPYAYLGPYGATLGNDPNFLKSPIFKQRKILPSSLEGALPWRQDGKGFIPYVFKLAQDFGYS
ncbi:sulfotransferase family protein [Aerosakkonema funiforme]|uniref:Sulfotransferase n=1 Tax=Aerosakkonema funiforme FACHB-1375 TaxID=2949571 RepID=A0A926VGF3_9CYAN|nr:sulfotransferase [Aerosakkonema funiforme]MBD2183259.1 sulfotransferase [Aerosakkonema funiforme FACHB-1375]